MWQKWRSKKACLRCLVFSGRSWRWNLPAEEKTADLIIGNNVLAQVPDINDFVEGLKLLLNPTECSL